MVALAVLDQGCQNQNPGAWGEFENGIDDLLGRLLRDDSPALGTVGYADARVQQPQVIVDLRRRAHGASGVVAHPSLVYAHRWGEALYLVHTGLLHLAQELAGVGREGLHIPPLAFGVDGIEGQAGLAGTGDAGDDHEFVPRYLQVYVL